MADSDLIQRYRTYRRLSGELHSCAGELIPQTALLEFGRRLGVLRHGSLVLDNDGDEKLLYDFAIHTRRGGRSRAIDRYARKAVFPPGSDHTRVLDALRDARFTLFRVQRRHEVAGVLATDILRQADFHLMDISIGLSAEQGMGFIGRLMEIDGFSMSCLTVLPAVPELVNTAMPRLPPLSDGSESAHFQDPRCVIAIYRAAIEIGVMQRYVRLSIDKELPTEKLVASIRSVTGRRSVDWPAPLAVR